MRMRLVLSCFSASLLVLVAACDASQGPQGSGGGATTGATASSTSSGTSSGAGLPAAYACEEKAFVEARPLSGPGYDPAQGGFVGTPKPSYVFSTTQIFVGSDQSQAFLADVGAIVTQLGSTPGLVAVGFGQDAQCGDYRTVSVWESEEDMMAFVNSGAHAKAIVDAPTVSQTGRVTFWTGTADDVKSFTWDVARQRIADVSPFY